MTYVAECRQCVPPQRIEGEEDACYRWAFTHSARTQHSVLRFVLDPDAEILAAARASNRELARRQEQRLLDAMRNPDA